MKQRIHKDHEGDIFIHLSIPSWVQKCLRTIPISVAALLMLSSDVHDGVAKKGVDIRIPPQETSMSTELKYYYIQQREWLVVAIEERYKDNNLSCPTSTLRRYESDIVGYFEDILRQEDATGIIYTFSQEELRHAPYLRDAFIWLMSARYGGDYIDIQRGINMFKNRVVSSELKIMIKFIKRDDGEFVLDNISILPNASSKVMIENSESEDLESWDGIT